MGTAAYAVLNYFEDQTGTYQVDQAIKAVGSAISGLKFMAVDVEYCCGEFVDWEPSHHYKTLRQTQNPDVSNVTDPAYHIQTVVTAGTSGATEPIWNDSGGQTKDGTVVWQDTSHVVIADATTRVQWISDAVNEITAKRLSPVIYTTRGFWSFYAGNCDANPNNSIPCPNLIQVPLWDSEKHCGDGTVGFSPFSAFPTKKFGWQSRSGNQYMISNTGCPQTVIDNVTVDLDYFDPNLFQ